MFPDVICLSFNKTGYITFSAEVDLFGQIYQFLLKQVALFQVPDTKCKKKGGKNRD